MNYDSDARGSDGVMRLDNDEQNYLAVRLGRSELEIHEKRGSGTAKIIIRTTAHSDKVWFPNQAHRHSRYTRLSSALKSRVS